MTIDVKNVTAAVVARTLGVTTRRVTQLAKEGIAIRSEQRARYDLPATVAKYFRNRDRDELDATKLEGMRIDNELATVKLKAEKGQYAKALPVQIMLNQYVGGVVKVMEALRTNVARTVPGMTPAGLEQLDRLVDKARTDGARLVSKLSTKGTNNDSEKK